LTNKGVIAASIVGGLVVLGTIVYFLAPSVFTAIIPPINGGGNGNGGGDNTTVASVPNMRLYVLQGSEDDSPAVAEYQANNTEPIELSAGAHIKFDSPDYRTAEGMTVTARSLATGEIELLRKSYDVNNQFFVNLDRGNYDIEVQAKWAEKGTFVYKFDVLVG
jgi:hypothetical protein